MKKILILLLLLILVASGCRSKAENKDSNTDKATDSQVKENINKEADAAEKEKNKMAVDFELESLDGTKIKLSELKGKNVIVNFWATWCGFCVVEMPDLQKLQDAYKDEDLIILAVNVGEAKDVVQKFVEENKLNLTVLLDTDSKVANTYGLRSFPSTLAVNKKGEIVGGYVGMLTYEQMEKLYSFFE